MKTAPVVLAALCLSALAACGSTKGKPTDVAVADVDPQADASAAVAAVPAAVPTPVAFGLSETQLLDADLVTADVTNLGEIEQIRRDAGGARYRPGTARHPLRRRQAQRQSFDRHLRSARQWQRRTELDGADCDAREPAVGDEGGKRYRPQPQRSGRRRA